MASIAAYPLSISGVVGCCAWHSVVMVSAVSVTLDKGLWSFVAVSAAEDGVLHWGPLPSTLDTFVLVAVPGLGDLCCSCALAGASRSWHQSLSISLRCFQQWHRVVSVPDGVCVCSCCADVGPAPRFYSSASCARASLARIALSQRRPSCHGQSCGYA